MAAAWRRIESGGFSAEMPGEWELREAVEGAVEIRDGRGEIVVTMIGVARSGGAGKMGGKEAQFELQKWVETQKQAAVKLSPRVVGGVRYSVATTEGAERSGGAWWRRIFRRMGGGGAVVWRFWAVVNPHLLVLASCRGKAEAMEKHRSAVDRMLVSVRLPEREILLGRNFTERVVSLAKRYFPELALAIIDDGHLRCGSERVSLVRLQRSYLASPEDLAAQVKIFFSEVRGEIGEAEVGESWITARRHVLPTFVETQDAEERGLLHEPWVNLLSIAFLLEDRGGERAVTVEDAKRWNVDMEMVHEQALGNLVAMSRMQGMEAHKSEGYTMLLLSAAEKHNAARLLLPGLHGVLREHLGRTFYAAIPTQELMLAFSTESDEVLGRVRQQIAADYARAKNGVSPRIFLVTPDGIAGDPGEREEWE